MTDSGTSLKCLLNCVPEPAEAELGVLPAVVLLGPVASLGQPEGLGRVGGPEL